MSEENNLRYYNNCKEVPEEAKKTIQGGRLAGFTDINPMWRIKKLTELFGPCGVGWKAPIVSRWIDDGAFGEKVVNVMIELSYKDTITGQWSDPIIGLGGDLLVKTERGKLVTNDDAYKMAYTDALSVACKLLGVAADVYYEKDKTKYTNEGQGESGGNAKSQKPPVQPQQQAQGNQPQPHATTAPATVQPAKTGMKSYYSRFRDLIKGTEYTIDDVSNSIKEANGKDIKINDLTERQFNQLYSSYYQVIHGKPWDRKTY